MVIDVTTERNYFVFFLRFLGNGTEFSGEIFCIVFKIFFRIYYYRFSMQSSPSFKKYSERGTMWKTNFKSKKLSIGKI